MRFPIPIYFACIFAAMLFYGIVSLLPARSKNKKKVKPIRKIEFVIAIATGLSGLGLLAWAYIWHNAMAKAIFNAFFGVWIAAGVVLWGASFVAKSNSS